MKKKDFNSIVSACRSFENLKTTEFDIVEKLIKLEDFVIAEMKATNKAIEKAQPLNKEQQKISDLRDQIIVDFSKKVITENKANLQLENLNTKYGVEKIKAVIDIVELRNKAWEDDIKCKLGDITTEEIQKLTPSIGVYKIFKKLEDHNNLITNK